MRFLRSLSILGVLVLFPVAAMAVQRTFVSAASGSDANPCSRSLPCRNFVAALPLTDVGGEVVALDSGGYGAVAITQSVQIISPAGVHAAITAFSGDAVAIDAGTGEVRIKGLALTGSGATNGIKVTNAGAVYVTGVSAFFFTTGLSCSASADVFVSDSEFSENGNGIQATAGQFTIDRTHMEHNSASGLTMSGTTNTSVTNSIAASNGSFGYSCSAQTARLTVEYSVAAHQSAFNTGGLIASSGCVARISNCTFVENYNGLQNYGNGATILSRGNNTIVDSVNPTVGTVGPFTPQ